MELFHALAEVDDRRPLEVLNYYSVSKYIQARQTIGC